VVELVEARYLGVATIGFDKLNQRWVDKLNRRVVELVEAT